jgi:predicted DsbA family dithiol-disulfide isomerase
LLRAYFTDGLDVGDPDVLARCAADVGMDPERVLAFLHSDDGVQQVRELMQAAAANEITAVPTYVIGTAETGPLWMVPGAQDTEVFVRVLRRAVERLQAAAEPGG